MNTQGTDFATRPLRLVAKFLLSNGYLDTLQTLSEESNVRITDLHLDEQDGEQVSLESLLEERRLRELSAELAKTRLAESEIPGWTDIGNFESTALKLVNPTNVLFTAVVQVSGVTTIMVTTADKAVRFYGYDDMMPKIELLQLHSSPILEARVVGEQYLLTAGMDGKVLVTDLVQATPSSVALAEPHTKYVNRLLVHGEKWIATSGYDKKVKLYEITALSTTEIKIALRSSLDLPSLPEGMLFTEHQDQLVLVLCARETCFLEYYLVPSLQVQTRINMNQNKDLWVSFAGVDISLQPTKPHYIGLSTSTTPYGRWLAFQVGKEDLKANVFHGAPQSDLGVLPRHVWRPDGSGFWVRYDLIRKIPYRKLIMLVNSDDGLIRGVELKSGKVVKTLQGHESAVRTLWAGTVNGSEVLVSGSFDKTVLIFRGT